MNESVLFLCEGLLKVVWTAINNLSYNLTCGSGILFPYLGEISTAGHITAQLGPHCFIPMLHFHFCWPSIFYKKDNTVYELKTDIMWPIQWQIV